MTFIREATVSDAAGIAHVIQQISEIRSVTNVTPEALAARVGQGLSVADAAATSTVLVAVGDDGAIAGYCAVHWVPFLFLSGGEAYITELFVRPADRGLGIGSSLLASVEERARQRGCARLSLLNGRNGEAYQRQFYSKRNWVLREHMANFVLPLSKPSSAV